MSEKKKKKPQKVKARLPRGFADRDAGDIRALDGMMARIREVYERYGFDPVETPMFEYTDTLGKFLPDTDRPNEGVFSVQDDDEQWMSLRYDLTAPLARYVAENYDALPKPYRSYRAGWVFRNEKPGPGRFRQFMQFDADTVGAPGVQADAEMCMMMADTMEALGIPRGQYVIRVNNRKVLDGVMEAIGVTDEAQKLAVLRAIDKLDKFGVEGVRKLLGEGRKDESGDFTKGAGLELERREKVVSTVGATSLSDLVFKFAEDRAEAALKWIVSLRNSNIERVQSNKINDFLKILENREYYGPISVTVHKDMKQIAVDTELDDARLLLKEVSGFVDLSTYQLLLVGSKIGEAGRAELNAISNMIESAGYADRIKIDPSVVRGLEYYTGMVYEAELLFPVTNEKGEEVVFGSVGGGGRYDGLVSRFRGEPVPATGFSIGVSRLMTALKNLGKISTDTPDGPVVVCVMDRDIDALAGYQQMVQRLRAAAKQEEDKVKRGEHGIPFRVEMFQGNPKQFGKQLQYADRRNSPLCIIQGSNEREQGIVQIKDMIEGKREAAAFESNAEYKAARPGQYEVPAESLVDEVKKRLAEQAADRDA
ncbi:MAG: histidine--tRNA ligase [Cohaesibacteraceae bacterium]